MYRTTFVAGFAFALGMGGVSTAHAGLLDFIFGWRDRTDIAQPAAAAHPTVTVTAPRKPARTAHAKSVTKKAVVAKAPPQLSPQDMLARTIDPNKNPDWYLEDPTLRKGDILVLNDRVVVFTGGRLGAPNSYVALSRSKLLTRQERVQVAAMTGYPSEPVTLAGDGPRQPRLLKSASLGAAVQPPTLGATPAPRS